MFGIPKKQTNKHAKKKKKNILKPNHKTKPNYNSELFNSLSKFQKSFFHIPSNRIYGRDIESSIIKETFSKVNHPTRCLLIGGHSGIGKTALVKHCFRELTAALNKEEFSFVSGKFSQISDSKPYSAIIEAFRQVVETMILIPSEQGSDKMKKYWISSLSKALGKQGRLITKFYPELERLIGKQNPLPEVDPDSSRLRFIKTFSSFASALTAHNHKLIIFIDDLQWSDVGSLNLVESLISNPRIIFVGAFRDNEISAANPLHATKKAIRKITKALEITLVPPQPNQLNRLCADTLSCKENDCMELTSAIYAKTSGNPLFFNLFLSQMYSDKLIRYSSEGNRWTWDIEKIKSSGFKGEPIFPPRLGHWEESKKINK